MQETLFKEGCLLIKHSFVMNCVFSHYFCNLFPFMVWTTPFFQGGILFASPGGEGNLINVKNGWKCGIGVDHFKKGLLIVFLQIYSILLFLYLEIILPLRLCHMFELEFIFSKFKNTVLTLCREFYRLTSCFY